MRSSSVSLPHCSFTAPLVCCQLPFIFSHIVFTSGETVVDVVVVLVCAWAINGAAPAVIAAHAARRAMERMGILLFQTWSFTNDLVAHQRRPTAKGCWRR